MREIYTKAYFIGNAQFYMEHLFEIYTQSLLFMEFLNFILS